MVSNFHLVAEVSTKLENTQKMCVDKAESYKDGRFFFYNPLFFCFDLSWAEVAVKRAGICSWAAAARLACQ